MEKKWAKDKDFAKVSANRTNNDCSPPNGFYVHQLKTPHPNPENLKTIIINIQIIRCKYRNLHIKIRANIRIFLIIRRFFTRS